MGNILCLHACIIIHYQQDTIPWPDPQKAAADGKDH